MSAGMRCQFPTGGKQQDVRLGWLGLAEGHRRADGGPPTLLRSYGEAGFARSLARVVRLRCFAASVRQPSRGPWLAGLPAVARRRRAKAGGEEGIRTPGSLSASTVFKTAALNHSAISPILIGGGPCTPPGNLRSLALRSGCSADRQLPLLPAWQPALACAPLRLLC